MIRGTVPTPEFRAQVLAQNQVYAPFMEQFPEATMASEPGAVTSTATLTREETRSDSNLTLRSDLNVSSANRLTGRYTRGRPDRNDPRLTAVNPRVYDGAQDFGTFSFTHAASRWVSETRAGLTRSVINRVDQLYVTGMPNISVEGLSLSDGEFFQKRGWLFGLDQVVAMTNGRHSLKAGFNMRHQRAGRSNFQTPGYSYSSLSDFTANIPSSVQFTFGLDDFQIRASQFGGFIQDDMRLGSNLVLNLGVRYDYFTIPVERDDRLFNRDDPWGTGPLRPSGEWRKADWNNVSPRVGFAWTPTSRAVVRGGAGVFVNPDPLFGTTMDLVLNSPDEQFRVTASRQDALRYGIAYPMSTDEAAVFLQGPAGLSGAAAANPNRQNADSMQYSLIVEHELGSTYSVEAAYVGNISDNLRTVRRINQPDRLTGIVPYDGFAEFRYHDAANSGRYNSLQLSLRRRMANRVSFGASYTLGKGMSYGNGDLQLVSPLQDSYNVEAEWGPTNWDVRHRLVLNFIYEVPPIGPSAWVRTLVGG
ncbi:MAG: hypothetical protein GEU99_20420 [Luteitalea sp.]|nr:hypothetical protein [Luteitalea sp.]